MRARHLLIAISALGAVSAPALAQIAPPPPPPAEPEPEFVPPPIPQPRPAPAPEAQTFKKADQPAERPASELPDLPYPPLWEFCGTEDPRVDEVCRFDDNLHYVALKPNPTISPGMVPAIQEVIVARRARFETMVIENLDVVFDVDRGLMQEIAIADPQSLADLLERIKPLTAPSSLTQELEGRKILSGVQAKFNNKIIGEYQRMYGSYLKRAYPEDSTDRFMRAMFEDSMVEPMQAFDGMLHESRRSIDRVLEKIDGVPDEARSALLALKVDSLDGSPDQRKESAEAVKMAWRPLSTDQKKQFLSAVRSLRENENAPPMPTINVMWAGKQIVEGKPPVRVVQPKDFEKENIKIAPKKEEGDGND